MQLSVPLLRGRSFCSPLVPIIRLFLLWPCMLKGDPIPVLSNFCSVAAPHSSCNPVAAGCPCTRIPVACILTTFELARMLCLYTSNVQADTVVCCCPAVPLGVSDLGRYIVLSQIPPSLAPTSQSPSWEG
jgi:hypothetical protein